ncbi:uncharacterized protein LOC133192932 [Saccostrea echinata]|uniref:uncharacterized protein LOC133192932 n=1 Tax=Saccostrea echinata TaxID=191078 RepID=UPI002A7FCC65|nr:uncharacterized protein LOC133192932 [Saccostrea echinata]
MSTYITLDELNNQEAEKFIPLLIIYVIYMVIGTLGNGTVLLVHPKLKHSDGRHFIPYLAAVNLTSSLIGSCFSILLIMFRVNFYSQSRCRFGWYIVTLTQTFASFILVVIASDHYRRICKPHSKQMNKRVRICVLLSTFFLAAMLAIPLPFQYKVAENYRSEYNLTTYSCHRSASSDPTIDSLYAGVLMLAGCCSTVAIFVLYCKIGQTLRRFVERGEQNEISMISLDSKVKEGVDNKGFEEHSSTTNTTVPSSGAQKKRTEKEARKKQVNHRHHVMTHFVKIFIMISLNYLLTLIPSAVIVVHQSISITFWNSLNDAQEVGLTFFSTLYIAHNIINPFIFAFMDHEFRAKLRYIITSVKCRQWFCSCK